ncbi:MAG: hypothetical protein A3F18_07715 [Legionellales bacterium RIFCSPHIGHO2_12_FULL_37_14]|nr:MAG: hypothetical protein A3F18_07715 [Legionellales bacterium RIFCSPHIGHO2_12_FULL_37_14]
MFSKIVVLLVMLVILVALGSGLFFLVSDKDSQTRLIKALTLRIGLSILLFIFLLSGFYFGWLSPHS